MKISATWGDSWIRWSWDTPNQTVQIYIDGTFATESSQGYYYLTDAQANSEHRIELINASAPYDVIGTSTARTAPPVASLLIALVMSFIFLLTTVNYKIGKDIIKTVGCGGMGGIIAIWGRGLAFNYYGLDWILLAITVGIGFTVGWAMIDHVQEALKW